MGKLCPITFSAGLVSAAIDDASTYRRGAGVDALKLAAVCHGSRCALWTVHDPAKRTGCCGLGQYSRHSAFRDPAAGGEDE